MGGTVPGSCPVTSFGVRIDEHLRCATIELRYVISMYW